ncbi:MAG: hypothetical protein IKN05_03090 [Clostridia bacterium]|nr:hypothetical protein [Clostridia bacterium]
MRRLTAVFATVFFILICLAGAFRFGGTLRAAPLIRTVRAADYPEAFGAIRELLASGSAIQALSGDAVSEDPAGYTLVDITVELTNRGLFSAEWLDISTRGAPGDIAVYAVTGEGSDIPARSRGQVNLKLITTARADVSRDVIIQYYVHGMKRTITVR